MTPAERRAARARPAAAAVPTPSQQAVHIEDRASTLFVLISVGVFVAIVLYAILLGNGGLLQPTATPSPQPSPSASPSVPPSASPSVPASPTASPTATPAASTVPTGSPAPSPS